jgi:hypothetical protein
LFKAKDVFVKYLGAPVLYGVMLNGMYTAPTVTSEFYNWVLPVDADPAMLADSSVDAVCVVSFERWHQRLGHHSAKSKNKSD